MGLARGDHVLDLGLTRRFEAPTRVGAVHGGEGAHNVALDGLGIGVFARLVVRSAAARGSDYKAAPRLGCSVVGGAQGEDTGDEGERERRRARVGGPAFNTALV